jgi:hypothetical protein
MTPRYPDITVKLVGEDGNAFAIMGRVAQAMRRHGIDDAEINQFLSECRSGNYDDLPVTCTRWVGCD